MKWTAYLRSFAFPRLLKQGQTVATVSLTAHDGRWVQSGDFVNDSSVLWIAVKDVTDDNTKRWLKSFSLASDQFQANNCRVLIVSSQSLDEIREMHRSIDLAYLVLYDPMALEARKLGLSGRRPKCRNAVLLVNEQGKVVDSQCGQSDVQHWLGHVGINPTGQSVDGDDSVTPIIPLSANETEILMEQGGVLVDVRTFSEYEPDHVPNSLHIPVDELPQRYEEIGQNSRIIFICQAGGRAYSAAEFMTSIGATDIFVVNGGMSSWTGLRNTDGVVS